jgi:hypothetical protein
MYQDKLDFLLKGYIPVLKTLPADAAGRWGKMNGQQMVEHVSDFFKVSANKLHFPLVTPAEHLPKFKAFLLSDKEFRENTKAPVTVLGEEPLPLRFKNMEEAIADLQISISEFTDHFKDDSIKTTVHPVFGELNFEEWILLHHKHIIHHLKQFGLN